MRFREFMLEAEPARKIPFKVFDVKTQSFKPVPGVTVNAGTKDARIMNFIQNNPNMSPQARDLAYSRMNPANVNIPEPKGWVAKFGRWFQNNIGKLGGKVSPLARIPGLNLVANSKALNAGEDAEIEFQRNLWKTDPKTYKELYPKGDIAAGPNTPGWNKLTPIQSGGKKGEFSSPETRTYSSGQAANKDLPNLPTGTTAIIGGKKYIITDPSNKLSKGKKAWTRDYDDSEIITKRQPQTKPKTEPGDDVDIITKRQPQTKPRTQPADPEIITQPKPRTKPKTNPDELPFIPKPKPQTKPEVKPKPKPEVKPQTKPEVKPQTKPEVKPQQQPRTQPQQKPRTQPAPRTQPQQQPRTQRPTTRPPVRPVPVPPLNKQPATPAPGARKSGDYIYTGGRRGAPKNVVRLK